MNDFKCSVASIFNRLAENFFRFEKLVQICSQLHRAVFCFALTFELECVCVYIYSREKYKKPVVTFEFSFMENLGELCRHVANISHARKEWRGAAYSGT